MLVCAFVAIALDFQMILDASDRFPNKFSLSSRDPRRASGEMRLLSTNLNSAEHKKLINQCRDPVAAPVTARIPFGMRENYATCNV